AVAAVRDAVGRTVAVTWCTSLGRRRLWQGRRTAPSTLWRRLHSLTQHGVAALRHTHASYVRPSSSFTMHDLTPYPLRFPAVTARFCRPNLTQLLPQGVAGRWPSPGAGLRRSARRVTRAAVQPQSP